MSIVSNIRKSDVWAQEEAYRGGWEQYTQSLYKKPAKKMPKSAKKFIFENPNMTKWFIPIFFLRMFFFMGNKKMVSKF